MGEQVPNLTRYNDEALLVSSSSPVPHLHQLLPVRPPLYFSHFIYTNSSRESKVREH